MNIKTSREFGMKGRVFALVAVLTLLSADAFAQKVRRFDSGNSNNSSANANANTSGATNTTAWYPGMPVPTNNSGEQAAATKTADGTKVSGSYVTTFNKAYQRKRGLALNLPQEKLYRGIIPGTRDDMPHLQRAKAQSGNKVTWIGFQPKAEGGSRVFIQTSASPSYNVDDSGQIVTVTLSDTGIPLRNFSRFIDTTFFKANVLRIESKQISSDTVVTITLREGARPSVDSSGNYVYLDF